jgi:hypothetical protein
MAPGFCLLYPYIPVSEENGRLPIFSLLHPYMSDSGTFAAVMLIMLMKLSF